MPIYPDHALVYTASLLYGDRIFKKDYRTLKALEEVSRNKLVKILRLYEVRMLQDGQIIQKEISAESIESLLKPLTL